MVFVFVMLHQSVMQCTLFLDQDILIQGICAYISSIEIFLSAMGKRGAPKSEPKAKAKAKSAPRASSSSSKAQCMTEDELGEYRLLHSKLTYRSKSGVAGADEALQQLKLNRQMVLDKFRGDKSMSWVPSFLIA